MRAPLMTIARMEFTSASRLWWIRLFMVAFALITVTMAQSTVVSGDGDPHDTFARLTVALLPLALMLVPLAGLLIGVSSVSSDHEASGFLLGLPLSPFQIIVGRWLGQAAALAAALVTGFGAGGVMVWASTGATDVFRLVLLVAGCALLALAFISMATLIAAAVQNRGAALGISTFVWFVAVIFYDAAALASAVWLTGRAGTRVLFASVFANVVDLVRILILTLAGTPHILGVAGESWMRTLGGPLPVAALAAASLAVWILVPVLISVRLTATRDL
jgi:Cu-processing system permease protein